MASWNPPCGFLEFTLWLPNLTTSGNSLSYCHTRVLGTRVLPCLMVPGCETALFF